MINRLNRIIDFLDREDEELTTFIPSRQELITLAEIFDNLKNFEQVTKRIQDPSIDLLVVRKLFDALIFKFPETAEYLSIDATIVESPHFESGICELLRGGESLSDLQMAVLQPFSLLDESSVNDSSWIDLALSSTRYSDVRYIPPTSNHAERFFSSAKHVLTDMRKSMLPKTFESLMFLKYNDDLWDARLLAAILNK